MKRAIISSFAIGLFTISAVAFPLFAPIAWLNSTLGAYLFSDSDKAPQKTQDEKAAAGALPTDLFISEYIEGSSNNKAIEIYNGTGSPVDLGTGGYTLELYSNGASVPSQSKNLDGVIVSGDVFVIIHPSATDAGILAAADDSNSVVVNFSGDDAVALRKNGVLIDVFGQIGFDPGTNWGSGLTSTADHTLVRKSSICAGDPNGSDAFDPAIEWDGFAIDTSSNLGSHTSNCLTAPGIQVTGGPLNYGDQAVGVMSASQSVTITNTGTADLVLGTLALTTGTQFGISSDPSGSTITPGNSTVASITFTPTLTGAKTDTLTIPSNAGGPAPTVSLTGTGINNPPQAGPVTVNGSVGTAQYQSTPTLFDEDGHTVTITGINSVTGGPAAAVASFTATTVTLTPINPSLATTAASPYVVTYSISDGFGGTGFGTVTVFVHDPPAVATSAATNVGSTSATLNGTAVNGVMPSTITARFRYATVNPGICNDSFGTRAPAAGSSTIGGGGAFSETISGLSPGTTYFYCAIASNTGGLTVGSVLSFTTGSPGAFNFDPQSYSPGEGGTATITVTRTGGSSGAVSVDFSASAGVPPATGGAACAFGTGVDYINVGGTLSFADGETSKTFDVVTCNDGLFEGTESVSFSLSNAQGGATIGGSSTATVNVLDDPIDFQPTIQFSMTDFDFSEGGNATVTVTRMFSPEHELTVNYAALVGGGSDPATPGACGSFSGNDFVPTSGTLTFLPGEDTKTFDVTLCDDGLFEPTESIVIALNTVSAPGVLSTPNTGRINITENDTVPSVEFSAATSSVGEGTGTKTFTVNRTGATENSFSVNFATANGTALSGSCGSGGDYVTNSGTLNFAGGDPNKTFNVTICDDGLFEGDETFSATLSDPTGGAVIGNQGTETATISEDDLTPLIQFSTDRYAGTEGSGVTVSIERTGALDNDVTADFNAGAGAGAACGQPGVDYELSNFTVHFAPGETLKQFGVPLCWEFLYEGNESWDMQLSNPTGGANIGTQSFAFIDITDSDTPPKFDLSSSATTVSEDTGTVTLNVNRTGASQNVVSVDYATTGGTATGGDCLSPGSDFLIQTGQLNFAAGDTSKTFNITICDDADFEGDESFTVSLSNPQYPSQLGTVTTATVTIATNDSVPEIDVSGNSVSISDGQTVPSLADHTDFGSISAASGTVSRTFTIANTGTGNLNLIGTPGVEVSGTNAADFNVTVQPGSPVVGPSGTTTFTVAFDPSAVGLRTATLSIANNDSDEDPYDFAIQGTGTAPVASFTATPNPTACNQIVSFNASGSTQADPSRPIVSYSWDFGDGQNGTGLSLTHAYSAFGTYTVVLTVADDVGAQDTESLSLTVNQGNQAPVASSGGPYILTTGNGVTLNGTGSTDPNAGCGDSIVVYEWDLDNDGQFDDAVGASPNLSAAAVASLFPTLNTPHTIGLRVTDEFGSQGTASTTLAVYQNAPIAAFTAIPNPAACNQTVNFNGSGSNHPNPTRSIVSYSWDFGDTTSGTGLTTTHAFSAFGNFNAVLTVTDNTGAQDTENVSINVNQGNLAPISVPGGPYSTGIGSGVSLNGSGSSDPNAGCGDLIVLYSWSVDSGTILLSGVSPSLTAAQVAALGIGSHTVQLTVTDSFGASHFAGTTLNITPPPPTLGNYTNTPVGLSGNMTVTPSAAPTNTTSINVSTHTSFKGTLSANAATGVVSITDAHPAGTYTVTVKAFGAGGTDIKTFDLTVQPGTSCVGVSGFTNGTDVSASTPLGVAVGDFNNDGNQDIAASGNSNVVSIRLGDGAGGFTNAANVSVGGTSYRIAVGDFNGDGNHDFVSSDQASGLSIRLGNGTGGFTNAPTIPVGSPYDVAVADFNGDAKQDIVVTQAGVNNVQVIFGDGAGGFAGAVNLFTPSGPFGVAVGDFNGDNKQDFATANLNSNNVSIRLGNGTGGFTNAPDVSVGTFPYDVTIGDFNGDGKQDLAAANFNSNNISVRIGDGAGNFSGTTTLTAGTNPNFVVTGDFNNDGSQDIATSNQGSNNVSVRFGNGAGAFSGVTDFSVGSGPSSMAIGDFNADGKQDFVTANTGAGNLSIRLGACYRSVTLSVNTNTADEATPTIVTVTATASSAVVGSQTVNLGVSGTDITAGDYNLSNSTIMIPDGGTTGSVTFTVVDDAIYEGTETATLTISSPSSGIALGGTTTQNIAITDNDSQPTFTFLSATFLVNEDVGTASFQVNRTGALGATDTVVAATVAGGTATGGASCAAGVDYIMASQTLTFDPSDSNKTLDVVVCQDSVFENPNETINLALTNPLPNGALGTPNTAVVTINNDGDAAATLVVDNISDNAALNQCTAAADDCSLRGALSIANDGDTISFALPPGLAPAANVITLGGSELLISSDVTISGPGADQLTIDGGGSSRVMSLIDVTANISGLTLSGGNGIGANFGGSGGALLSVNGTLTLDGVRVTGNTAVTGAGGAVLINGTSHVVRDSTFDGNSVTGGINAACGGLEIMGDATLTNITVSGNSATGQGGGLCMFASTVLRNSTITNNQSDQEGGGLFAGGTATFDIGSTIIAGNTAPVRTEIGIASGAPVSAGFNLIGNSVGDAADTQTPITYQPTDILDTNPQLGGLSSNGGPTPTHALLTSPLSPAIDQGSAFGSSFEQRGLSRTYDFTAIGNAAGGDGTDIGAFEIQAPTAAPASISGRVLTAYGQGIRGAIVTVNGGDLAGPRSLTTGTFGYFRLDGLHAGQAYVISVYSRKYSFIESVRLINLTEDAANVNFVASP